LHASARRVLRSARPHDKRAMTYWRNLMPHLDTRGKKQPVCTLTWKSKGLIAELTRTILISLRSLTYLWATVTMTSIVLLPVAHSTTWFMATIGILVYDRFVLIALDALPGVVSQVQEVSIR